MVIERIIKDLRAHLVSKSVSFKVGVQIRVQIRGCLIAYFQASGYSNPEDVAFSLRGAAVR